MLQAHKFSLNKYKIVKIYLHITNIAILNKITSGNKNIFDGKIRKYKTTHVCTYVTVYFKTSVVKNISKGVSKQTYADNKLSNQLCTY